MPPIYMGKMPVICVMICLPLLCAWENPYRVPSRVLLNGSRVNLSGMLSLGKSYTTKVRKGSDSDMVVLIWDPPDIFHMKYIDASHDFNTVLTALFMK